MLLIYVFLHILNIYRAYSANTHFSEGSKSLNITFTIYKWLQFRIFAPFSVIILDLLCLVILCLPACNRPYVCSTATSFVLSHTNTCLSHWTKHRNIYIYIYQKTLYKRKRKISDPYFPFSKYIQRGIITLLLCRSRARALPPRRERERQINIEEHYVIPLCYIHNVA